MQIKNVERGRVSDYLKHSSTAKYFEGQKPWKVAKGDMALPCATQNEIDADDAKALAESGCYLVAEGANMPSDSAAIEVYQKAGIMYGPGKAANAGGVACSGLEMAQNSVR